MNLDLDKLRRGDANLDKCLKDCKLMIQKRLNNRLFKTLGDQMGKVGCPVKDNFFKATICLNSLVTFLHPKWINKSKPLITTPQSHKFVVSQQPTNKRINFLSADANFRGLGSTASASQQVSVSTVIRASADWTH
ncbi:hypothetical protein RYX36_001599 [Vicia faba]